MATCCTHNCRQGRDCPLRKPRGPALRPWRLLLLVARWMGRELERAHLRWALREMDPMHPDLPYAVRRLRELS